VTIRPALRKVGYTSDEIRNAYDAWSKNGPKAKNRFGAPE